MLVRCLTVIMKVTISLCCHAKSDIEIVLSNLTLNMSGFLQIGMAGEGKILLPLCDFCLDGQIDLKLDM